MLIGYAGNFFVNGVSYAAVLVALLLCAFLPRTAGPLTRCFATYETG